MRVIVKHNGIEVPEVLCTIDTANNTVLFETMFDPCIKLDLDKVYVEVNLFGELVPLEDEED